MDYTKILKRAWEITWRHKALWLFGFLLALVGGGGGGGGGRGAQYVTGAGDQLRPGWILVTVLLLLIIVLVLVVVSVIVAHLSRAALIGMVREVEETGNTSVRSGWRMGWSRFLPLFAIDLVINIPVAIAAFVLIVLGLSPLLLLLAQRRILAILAIVLTVLLMLVFGILLVVGLVLSVVRELAYRQCVLERKGVLDCIRDAYRMGRENLRHVGVVWLLLFGINLAVGIVLMPLFLLVVAIAAGPALVVYGVTEALAPALVVGIPLGILGILFLALLGGIHQVFRSATWTLAYLELQARDNLP